MNCEHCQEHLLDLVYGEVDGSEADALRAHVDGCDGCRASLDKLTMAQRLVGQLPMLEAPEPIGLAIMEAARAHVGEAPAGAAARESQSAVEEEGLWARFLRWAGSFAMGPQVAMATIMLLVVSIGLWYFPSHQRMPEGTGSTVMSPDIEGEVGPSATLEAADPLALDLDERTGRIRAQGAEEDARLARQVERPAAAAPLEARDQAAANVDDDAPAFGDGAGRVVDGRLVEAEELARSEDREARGGAALDVDSLADLGREGSGASSGALSSAGSASTTAEAERSVPPRRRTQAGAPSADGPSPAPAAAPSSNRPYATETAPSQQAPEPPPANAREAYARGMQRYQQGNFWGAAEDFSRVYRNPDGQTSLVPSALHHLARSYRRANRCNLAEPQYRSLMSRYPSYSGTPRAMMELADCYRILGRLSDSRATLEQAQRHASVASEARRELLRVRQMERAADRADSMEADEAAAEALSY